MTSAGEEEPLQPVEEVIVATKVKSQTGEREYYQPVEEQLPPVEEAVIAQAAAPQTEAPEVEAGPPPCPPASPVEELEETEIEEEVIIPSRAVPQTGERSIYCEPLITKGQEDAEGIQEESLVAEKGQVEEGLMRWRPRPDHAVRVSERFMGGYKLRIGLVFSCYMNMLTDM